MKAVVVLEETKYKCPQIKAFSPLSRATTETTVNSYKSYQRWRDIKGR